MLNKKLFVFSLDLFTKSTASDHSLLHMHQFFVIMHNCVYLNTKPITILSVTLHFLYINVLSHNHFHTEHSTFFKKIGPLKNKC